MSTGPLAASPARPFDVLALGGVCWEQVVGLSEWPTPGHRRTSMTSVDLTPGGSAPNVSVFAARAGARAAFAGKVGVDDRGLELLACLNREGVNTSYAHAAPGSPTTFQIVLTVKEDWSVLLLADPRLDLGPEDVPTEAIRQARFLHLDGYGMFTDRQKAAMEKALTTAHASRTPLSVDAGTEMASEQPEYLRDLMAQADVAFANLTEARLLTGRTDDAEVIQSMSLLGPKLVVLKMGERGAWALTQSRATRIPAFRVRVVDTVGAGDGMVAGMLAGLCRGESVELAARRGAAVGALVCTGAGSLGSRFGETEIEELLAKGETYG